MLVGQDHFVEVGRDGDFVVGEIAQPGAAAVDGVGQQRQHIGQRDGDGLQARGGEMQWRRLDSGP